MWDIEPILGLNFEKIDLEVKKTRLSKKYKKMPIYFLISLKKSTCNKNFEKSFFEKKSSPGPIFGPKMA